MSSNHTTQEMSYQIEVNNIQHQMNVFDSLDKIQAIKEEWQNLEKECKEPFTCYQSYSWCFEYYKNYANDLSNRHSPLPQLITLHQKNRLVMIWPLMKIQTRTGLELLTSATDPLGKYSNILYDQNHFTAKTGQSVLMRIREVITCDAISINNYPTHSMIESVIAEQGIRGKSNKHTATLALQNRNQSDELEQKSAKLAEQGSISFKVHKAGSESFTNLVRKMFEFRSLERKHSGAKPDLLDEKATSEMIANLNETDLCDACLHVLSIDEKPVCIEFGIYSNDQYHSYTDATDLAWASYAPYPLLMTYIIERANKLEVSTVDFGEDASQYKKARSNSQHALHSCNIPLTTRGYIYSKLWKAHIRPLLKSFSRKA